MPARLLSALALGLFIASGAFAAEAPAAAGGKTAQTGAATAAKKTAQAKTAQATPVARKAPKQARKPGKSTAQHQARRQTQKPAAKPVSRQAAKPAPRRVATSATTKAAVAAAAGAGAKKVAAADSDQLQATRRLAIASGAALVVDQEGGEAIYQKNADQVVPIASITKLMTAMVVLDAVPALHDTITITRDDVDTLRGSRSRLRVGARLTREDALLLALMSSENRASNALARHYPGGLSAFVAAMNRKAIDLGMYHTRFEEPTGLSSNNVSTAQDLVRLVVAAHRYPLIREFSTRPGADILVSGQPLAYSNTNRLVKNASWDIGLSKTGFINEAGRCLVMQAWVADKPVVIVLLDSTGTLTRIGDANRIKRWMESTQASSGSKDRNA